MSTQAALQTVASYFCKDVSRHSGMTRETGYTVQTSHSVEVLCLRTIILILKPNDLLMYPLDKCTWNLLKIPLV